jgi:hypothetical protein
MGVLNIMLMTGEHWTPGRDIHDLGACHITHGPNDSYFEDIADKSVASVRRALAGVCSIADDAEAFIGGLALAAE